VAKIVTENRSRRPKLKYTIIFKMVSPITQLDTDITGSPNAVF